MSVIKAIYKKRFWIAVLFLLVTAVVSLGQVLSRSSPQACDAPAYSPTATYQQGSQVTNVGRAFECWKDSEAPVGSWQWCSQTAYNPGQPSESGAEHWPAAWKNLGSCEQPESNTLELSFSTVTGSIPYKATQKGVGAGPGGDLEVSGVLRCKAESIPFSGRSDEAITLRDLKPCKYDVLMNTAQGFVPITTPTQVEFEADNPQKISLEVKFRRPIDTRQLLGLPGVSVEVFVGGLAQPRQMAMGNNVLYVGSSAIPNYSYEGRTAGFIYALPLDGAGKPTGVHLIASGLEEPHGVAYRNGDLYYSTTGAVYRVRNVDSTFSDPHPERVLTLPADDVLFPLRHPGLRIWHQKHPLHFNPNDPGENRLYTAVGIPCNLCMIPPDERYGTLVRYDLETGASQILARGVRNSVGQAWSKKTGKLWFTDNNRQGFANADEVNLFTSSSDHFGVPYVFGRDTPGFTEREFQEPESIQPPLAPGAIVSDKPLSQIDPSQYRPPAYELGTNTAPLGITFWSGFDSPQEPLERLLVATHGTGSSSDPGMDVRMLTIKDGTQVINQIPLVTGWVRTPDNFDVYCLNDSCLGRPTDMLELADGSLLISDDVAGVIYRVTFDESGRNDTYLRLQPTSVPAPELRPLMVSGALVDGQGNRRNFEVAWGTDPLELKGLADGEYRVTLNNVGNWIPVTREQAFTFDRQNTSKTLDLTYKERPAIPAIKARLVAPPKPSSSQAAAWIVNVESHGEHRTIEVPWGGEAVASLDFGDHKFSYPYYSNAMPEPSQRTVSIDEDSTDFTVAPMNYQQVDDLGHEVLTKTCSSCHSLEYFDDPNKAITWSNAGRDALIRQIMSMPVSGHCDSTCAGEVANHLFNVVWPPYLAPERSYGKRQLRLLTAQEYANSIHDLFGVVIDPEKLPADKSEKEFKYPGEADHGVLNAQDVKSFYDMAWFIAEQGQDGKVLNQSVEQLGHRVFRRALSAGEKARYQRVQDEHGVQSLIASLLLSPHFLYRSELGDSARSDSGEYPLTANERATALSYTLLGTTPSDELMAQAEQGQLHTPEQVRAKVDQMLATDRGVEQFNHFISYYLKTIRGTQEKPGLDAPLIQTMVAEQYQLVREVLRDRGTIDELFNPGYTFLNQTLAEHYGIAGVVGDQLRKVDVDARRGGILHLGLTQAANSDYQATSLVKRGIMMREQLLCREFGAPVEADPLEPQFPARAISTRERWDLVNGEHASEGRCWQCHKYMNDTGSAMEHYDAAGRYRTQENAYNFAQYPVQVPIDAKGPFISNTGLENWADVDGIRDIARLLPTNVTAQTCMADSYYRFMFGNKVDAGSAGTLKAIADGLKENGLLLQMIRDLASSSVFFNRQEGN